MAKPLSDNARRSAALKELRQLAQDRDVAFFLAAVLVTELGTQRLEEIVQQARMAAAKLPL